ncbi:MAG: hypothetical protein ACD_21C00265G0004 [uncultured bacterium]|nr:MAG: hypothetical protein ACD_21C00265G0004 [uncultured bacterium]
MTTTSLAVGVVSGNNNDDDVNDGSNKEQLKNRTGEQSEIKTKIGKEEYTNPLGYLTAKKMIHGLLTCDTIYIEEGKARAHKKSSDKWEIKIPALTKEELSVKLGITPKEINRLKRSPNFYNSIINKISLPLIKLYCSVKFADSEYKGN